MNFRRAIDACGITPVFAALMSTMSVLHGINAVAEAIKASPEKIERICVERGQKNPRIQEIIELARQSHIRISFEEKSWLDRKAEGARHQGILCFAAEMATLDAEDILEQAKSPGLLVILDGIEDPHNLGAILRSAEAAGADGVFLPQHRSAALSAAVVTASAGAASHVKLARVTNIAQLIESLKKRGYWVAGLDAAGSASHLGNRPYRAYRIGPGQRGKRPAQTRQGKM